jgi:hypothetical protein
MDGPALATAVTVGLAALVTVAGDGAVELAGSTVLGVKASWGSARGVQPTASASADMIARAEYFALFVGRWVDIVPPSLVALLQVGLV